MSTELSYHTDIKPSFDGYAFHKLSLVFALYLLERKEGISGKPRGLSKGQKKSRG